MGRPFERDLFENVRVQYPYINYYPHIIFILLDLISTLHKEEYLVVELIITLFMY